MGKVRRNFYIGFRVPWTLASDRVWEDTHRLATWVMVAAGLIGFVLVVAGFTPLAASGTLDRIAVDPRGVLVRALQGAGAKRAAVTAVPVCRYSLGQSTAPSHRKEGRR